MNYKSFVFIAWFAPLAAAVGAVIFLSGLGAAYASKTALGTWLGSIFWFGLLIGYVWVCLKTIAHKIKNEKEQ